jgi:ubiquinone/menaquinone biosynthesis C-methylase UbiE
MKHKSWAFMNKLIEKEERIDVKPEYGFYIGYSLVATFAILGALGLVSMILGFYIGSFLNLILWMTGAVLVIVFLWPALVYSFTDIAKQDMPRPLLRSYDFSEFEKPEILDCGCGTGRRAIPLIKRMPKGAFLTGIDIYDAKSINVNALERVQKNPQLEGVADRTKFMVGSVTEIPFEDEKFDVVTCVGVLHEIRDTRDKEKALREIYRVLKPNGVFYFGELDRITMIPYMGLMGLLLKNRSYWEKYLIKNKFRITESNVQGGVIEFIARKV